MAVMETTRSAAQTAVKAQPPAQRKRDWGIYATHAALIVIIAFMALPLLYALLLSTFTQAEAFTYPPRLVPGSDLAQNVRTLFDRHFGQQLLNTVFIALIVVTAKTTLSLLAGLAFVYFRFPGKWILFFFVLLTLLMPTEIIIVPLFNFVADLGWGNTFFALTVPFFASATGSFLFRQHFSNIPGELAEAAQLDGAGPLRFLWSVLVPMSWNVVGAMAVIQFIYMWNQYLWPVLIMNSPEKKVVQQGVRDALQVGAQTDFGPVMAAAVIASIPPLLVFVLLQKQFMSGFALTRDK